MRILLDITRTLVHSRKITPTGIDRVEHAYVRSLLDSGERFEPYFVANTPFGRGALTRDEMRVLFASLEAKHLEYEASADHGTFETLAKVLARPVASERQRALVIRGAPANAKDDISAVARAFLRGALRFRRLLAERKPSIYLHTSHLQLDEPRCFTWLKDHRVFPVFLIHDLIPIEFPEFCSPGASRRHAVRIDTALRHGKALVANSAFTRESLRRFAGDRPLPPTAVVPLANTIRSLAPSQLPAMPHPEPYFLHVGTIEGRKNIGHLLNTWRHLIETEGVERTPRLVLAGRRGWECENVTAMLDRSIELANHVIEVSGIDDAALQVLMKNSAGLITVSMTEGFGLPPVEAAQMGVPVIASDIPAHREILGDAADFVAHHDGQLWQSK